MMQLLQHPAHGHVDAEDIGDMAINIRTTFCFVIQLLISTALFFRLLWKIINLHFSTCMNIQPMSCPSTRQKVPREHIVSFAS